MSGTYGFFGTSAGFAVFSEICRHLIPCLDSTGRGTFGTFNPPLKFAGIVMAESPA